MICAILNPSDRHKLISTAQALQRKEGNDSVGKNVEPENLKESGKDASFKSKEEQSYVSVKSTKNGESVYNKSRRLGGVRANRSWNRLRNHVKSASLEKFPDHHISKE